MAKNSQQQLPEPKPAFDINARARSVYGPKVHWAFHHVAEAWYADSTLGGRKDGIVDEINLELADEDGGCVAEAMISFHNLDRELPAPNFEIFHDAWAVFFGLAPELFATLAMRAGRPAPKGDPRALREISADEICDRLLALGFADETERERK